MEMVDFTSKKFSYEPIVYVFLKTYFSILSTVITLIKRKILCKNAHTHQG